MTPFVRIPPNGGELNQWIAKQVLDSGVYGVVWPHVSTVEDARNAVAACRYPRPKEAPHYEPAGQRGDAPAAAARYWGLTQQEYYARADVWPLAPQGEVLVVIMCEEVRAIDNLPRILRGGARASASSSSARATFAGPRLSTPVRPPDGRGARSSEILPICKEDACPAAIPTWTRTTSSGCSIWASPG